jgi:predicted metal-dependent hydrolase
MGQLFFAPLISRNAQLLFLPPELVTYVLVREWCHTKHLTIHPDFGACSSSIYPNTFYRQLRNGSRWMPGWLTAS